MITEQGSLQDILKNVQHCGHSCAKGRIIGIVRPDQDFAVSANKRVMIETGRDCDDSG